MLVTAPDPRYRGAAREVHQGHDLLFKAPWSDFIYNPLFFSMILFMGYDFIYNPLSFSMILFMGYNLINNRLFFSMILFMGYDFIYNYSLA